MRAKVTEIFHLWLSLVCKPQTLCPAEWLLQPYLELGSVSPQWALDPRHGPPLHGPPSPETPAVLTSLRRVPSPLRVLAQAGAASPTVLQGRSGFALLPAGVQVLRTRLYLDPHQAHTFASFLPPASPHIVLLQNPPSRLTGFLASAVPRSNPEQVFLTHLTVSFWPSGPPHCPLHPSAAGAAVMTSYLLTLSLPPDHCPCSFLSGNPFSFSDVCPMPSILGDLALSHLLQAAFLDFQVRLRPLCLPLALGLLLVLAVITVIVWSFATFLITGDSPLTLSLWPCPGFVSGADGHIHGPGHWSPELLG